MSLPTVHVSRWSPALRSVALGHIVAVLALVAWTEAHDSRLAAVLVTLGALALGGAAAQALAVLVPRPRLGVAGAALAATGLALLGVTPRGAITVLEAVVLGAGLGLASPAREGTRAGLVVVGAGALGAEIAVAAAVGGRTAAFRVAAVVLLVVAAGAVADRGRRATSRRPGRDGLALGVAVALLAVGLVGWVAANDPTVEWFGHITTHGDRHGDRVAITFDDGPDAQWTMQVAGILDAHGVKGTFFEVGKAIDRFPEVARSLRDDGHLLGNHSYNHDYTGWLDPGYPELADTQAAFQRAVGQCPALFRPPHGQRTPFMLAKVSDRGMHAVTWDVSARDWVVRNGHEVAQRILADVRPGSIILLHDGLDGKGQADRSVLAVALPEILDGLAAKGLHPVRLDELLGVPGYLSHC